MLDINTILSQQLEMHMNESQTLKYHLKVSVNLGSSMINIGSICLIFSSMNVSVMITKKICIEAALSNL